MERQEEHWKPIKGFEDYLISDKGRVWSHKTNKIMSQFKINTGYLQVVLYNNGKSLKKSIHRLVAQAFIPNPEGLPETHHINEKKDDNRVENLEWVSTAYNVEFSLSKYYVLYDPNDERCEIYNLHKFAKDNELNHQNLFAVVVGKLNGYMGFTRHPGVEYTRKRKGSFRLISPSGEIFTFESQQKGADYVNCADGYISQLLSGKVESCQGWRLHPFDGIFAFVNENQKI